VLAPWPNRLGDGRYSFDGRELQLPLSEPEHHNAIHGLLRWLPWRALEHEPDRVVVSIRLHPRPGYPFDLRVTVEYALGADGLTVRSTARNLGDVDCPYGIGHHPYLSAGGGSVDECLLELPAATVIETDPERGLPTGRAPVDGGPLDFRHERRLGGSIIDSPFTDLARDGDGRSHAYVTRADGTRLGLWVDRSFEVLEVFTGDTLAPARRRTGIAIEPMTCPPDAFRSGEHLIRVAPGGEAHAGWGIGLVG
jgi:aldose 1-epimerase